MLIINNKRILGMILIICCIIPLSASAQGENTTIFLPIINTVGNTNLSRSELTTVYVDQLYGFSIDLPSNWSAIPSQNPGDITQIMTWDRSIKIEFGVYLSDKPSSVDLQTWSNDGESNTRLLHSAYVTHPNGFRILRQDFSPLHPNPTNESMTSFLIDRDGKIFFIFVPQTSFIDEPNVAAILRSLQYIKEYTYRQPLVQHLYIDGGTNASRFFSNAGIAARYLYRLPFVGSFDISQGPNGNGCSPYSHTGGDSEALDFSMDEGTPIYAARGGTAHLKSSSTGYGNSIEILHPDGQVSRYAHLRAQNGFVIADGANVYSGQPIGYSGNTGRSDSPHLHFQVEDSSAADTHVWIRDLFGMAWISGNPYAPCQPYPNDDGMAYGLPTNTIFPNPGCPDDIEGPTDRVILFRDSQCTDIVATYTSPGSHLIGDFRSIYVPPAWNVKISDDINFSIDSNVTCTYISISDLEQYAYPRTWQPLLGRINAIQISNTEICDQPPPLIYQCSEGVSAASTNGPCNPNPPTLQPTATVRSPTATPTPRFTATPYPPTVTSVPTNTPRPATATPIPQSCTNPPPDRNVAYLFDNTNCVNPWNWSSGHPSDSANRNAKSAWMPSGKVLVLSENNSGSEPTVCLRSPVQNLADIGWGNRVEWASLQTNCPVIQPTSTPSGPKHEAKFYEEPNFQNLTFTLRNPGTYYPANLGHVDQFRKFYSVDLCSGCSIELTNKRGDSICWGWDENNIGDHGDWPLVTTRIKFSHENDCPPRQPELTVPEQSAQYWQGDSLQIAWKDNDDPTSMYFTVQVKLGVIVVAEVNRTTSRTMTLTNLAAGSYTILAQSCSNIRCSNWQTRLFSVRTQPTATPTATFTPQPTQTSTPTATSTQCPPPPPSPSNLIGDVDGDGDVDDDDLKRIIADFYRTGCPGWLSTDIDLDGLVDIMDWSAANLYYGQTLPTATPTATATSKVSYPVIPAIPNIQFPQTDITLAIGEIVTFRWEMLSYPVDYLIYVYNDSNIRVGDSGKLNGTTWQYTFSRRGIYYWTISSLCSGCQNYFSGYSRTYRIVVGADVATATPTPIPTPTIIITPTATVAPNPVCSVSIGDGRLYTNQREITIYAHAPGAAEVQLSNDGGFGGATWQPYAPTLAWTLSEPPQKVATLLIFARFRDQQANLLCSSGAIIDDIIYDAQPPVVQDIRFTLDEHDAARAAHTPIRGKLTITATDQAGGSGVPEMRFGVQPDLADANWQPFTAAEIAITLQDGQTLYAQVRDGAGNPSALLSHQVSSRIKLFLPLVER